MLLDGVNENSEDPWNLPQVGESFLPGDLLFFWGTDWPSRLIRLYTWGPSHVGMIADFRWRPRLDPVTGNTDWVTERYLVESTTLIADSPCRIQGIPFAGVQAQPIQERIDAYRRAGGWVEQWRLDKPWTPEQLDTLSEYLYGKIGTEYDLLQAIDSGTLLLQHVLACLGIGGADDRFLYCSEISGNALKRCDHGNPNWNTSKLTPAGLRRWMWWTGNGRRVAQWEPSPAGDEWFVGG